MRADGTLGLGKERQHSAQIALEGVGWVGSPTAFGRRVGELSDVRVSHAGDVRRPMAEALGQLGCPTQSLRQGRHRSNSVCEGRPKDGVSVDGCADEHGDFSTG